MSSEAILCVDDEAVILLAIKQELRRHFSGRYTIETAMDAAEAQAIIEELESRGVSTALVISDWMMPGMRGDQFLVELHAKRPGIKAILITGLSDEDSEKAWKDSGLCACIRKPWRSEELYRAIENCLAGRGQSCDAPD
ncbi:MAG TPA: response regulator [Rectinemataceae bacterium]|nr:response regulator [Rectinemataceae bacterium]